MKISKNLNVSWLNFLVLPAIGGCFIAAIFLFEWIQIGIIADQKIISKYYFGTEAMIAHGGWRYNSASTYAWSAFTEGILLLFISCLTFWGSVQSKTRIAFCGSALIVLWLTLSYIGI